MHRGVEAEPGEDAPGAGGCGTCADLVEACLDLGDAQRLRPAIEFAQQRGALLVGGEHGVERRRRAVRRLLRQKSDTPAARHEDVTAIGKQPAADQVEQGRFAGAVAPDEFELTAIGNLGIGFVSSARPWRPPTR